MARNTTANAEAPTIEKLDPKVDGSSLDVLGQNIETMRSLFPEVFTERSNDDGPRWKVDLEKLGELLGEYVEDKTERYSFNWHGKSRARRIAQTPSTGTLRPCPEESVNWDTTKNIFIEGDNLEVLKLLQKSYHKRVKMIYIDPPYNTGKEFIYPDKFQDNLDTYLKYTGQVGGDGLKISANAETGGRYHTNWLNMMYPRLKLARNLLRDDGVIFISIDDHEFSRLRALCDEIFGEENFITTVIWQRVYSPKNSAKYFSEDHDYVLVYAKSAEQWEPTLLPRTDEANARYKNPDNDPRGPWKSSDLTARNYYGDGQYEITGPTGKTFKPGRGRYWRQSLGKFQQMVEEDRIWWGPSNDSTPAQKRFLTDVKQGIVPQTLWTYSLVGHTQDAKKELLKYVDFEHTENVLNSVKPTKLLRHILKIATTPNEEQIVLDFFAGSAPLGHAVFTQNLEDNGQRRFILVQLPEELPKDEPQLATIADLGKSRLKNVVDELGGKEQLGFRVFKLGGSNVLPWNGEELTSESLLSAANNVDPNCSDDDVVCELLLKFGLDLSTPIESREIDSKNVFVIGAGALVVCLAENISLEFVDAIADLREEFCPEFMRVIFMDSSFSDDVAKTNAIQILRQRGIEDVKSL